MNLGSPAEDADDLAYHRSVRNTAVVLGVVVAVIAASLALTSFYDVPQNTFNTRTTVATAYPFVLGLSTNSSSAAASGGVLISAWLNGTSTGNVTAVSQYLLDTTRLLGPPCVAGYPIGVGVMRGHYTMDNYSLGTLLQLKQPLVSCVRGPSPAWFFFSSSTSRVLVSLGGTPAFWVVRTDLTFSSESLGLSTLSPGVYTAVAADEWGDLVMTNFRVS